MSFDSALILWFSGVKRFSARKQTVRSVERVKEASGVGEELGEAPERCRTAEGGCYVCRRHRGVSIYVSWNNSFFHCIDASSESDF